MSTGRRRTLGVFSVCKENDPTLCPRCGKLFDDPKIMVCCGRSLCNRCMYDLSAESDSHPPRKCTDGRFQAQQSHTTPTRITCPFCKGEMVIEWPAGPKSNPELKAALEHTIQLKKELEMIYRGRARPSPLDGAMDGSMTTTSREAEPCSSCEKFRERDELYVCLSDECAQPQQATTSTDTEHSRRVRVLCAPCVLDAHRQHNTCRLVDLASDEERNSALEVIRAKNASLQDYIEELEADAIASTVSSSLVPIANKWRERLSQINRSVAEHSPLLKSTLRNELTEVNTISLRADKLRSGQINEQLVELKSTFDQRLQDIIQSISPE